MTAKNIKLFIIFCFSIAFLAQGFSNEAIRLPDGSKFASWDDQTVYRKTYHVNQSHPAASDANPGTAAQPFLTINHAAQVVKAGEKVVVHGGIYREKIVPKHGGISAENMICYQAARGENVVVKGSRILKARWKPSIDPHGERYSHKLWQTRLTNDLFPYNENPFLTPNASEAEIDVMPWAERWKGRVPYTLPRGLVFQDGRRLAQMAMYEDLNTFPGTYWVDIENHMLHVHPLGSYHPENSAFEITVQDHVFKPNELGLGFIKIEGFIFEQVGNGFPRIGTGAVYVYGGHHWIIEHNVVRQVNSVGIETGARVKEAWESPSEEKERAARHAGGFIVRNNHVYACGTGGIEGHTLRDSLIQGNHVHHIGWQDVERYWECAGIKLLCNTNNVVMQNHIHQVESASAIWLDWDNRNSRVTRNVIHDIAPNHNGAIFIEASRVPNLVDSNIVWNADCIGVSLFDTDHTTVAHNLIAKGGEPVFVRVNTDRHLDGVPLSAKNNTIVNNLFYSNDALPVIKSEDNVCDYNLYADRPNRLDLKRCFAAWEENGAVVEMDIHLDAKKLELAMQFKESLPHVPMLDIVPKDMFLRPRGGKRTTPGPLRLFGNLDVTLDLCDRYK